MKTNDYFVGWGSLAAHCLGLCASTVGGWVHSDSETAFPQLSEAVKKENLYCMRRHMIIYVLVCVHVKEFYFFQV